MLILTRKIHECIVIGENIHISVIEIRGEQVRLGIDAPAQVKVYRKEVFDAIQAENQEAVDANAGDLGKLSFFFSGQTHRQNDENTDE